MWKCVLSLFFTVLQWAAALLGITTAFWTVGMLAAWVFPAAFFPTVPVGMPLGWACAGGATLTALLGVLWKVCGEIAEALC